MSSAEKQSKGKTSKKATVAKSKSPKDPKGKETPLNEEKFRGDGVHFKCKLLGLAEVNSPRGDSMCIDAIKKLKQQVKHSGEHKQKIILVVTLKGIRILDEKSKALVYEHPINKVSFITHDPEDKKIFGYVCTAACQTGHMMYAIKYDKVAGIITATLYELFQVVFKLRQDAAQRRKMQANASPQIQNGPSPIASQPDNNIYEEPKTASPAIPIKSPANNMVTSPPSAITSNADKSQDGHYKVPTSRPLPPKPYGSSSSALSHQETKDATRANGVATPEPAASQQPPPATPPSTRFTSDTLFSTSVFAQGETASADTASISSVEMIRKGSMSSTSSDTADTRSVDSKSAGVMSTSDATHTPPVHHAFKAPAFQATFTEEPDYETIESDDYEIIPVADSKAKVSRDTDSAAALSSNNFAAFGSEFQTDKRDFGATEDKNAQARETPSKAATKESAFAGSDLFAKNDAFGESNFDTHDKAISSSDVFSDDPFLRNAGMPSNASLDAKKDLFVSTEPFDSAFGSGKFSPIPFNPSITTKQTEDSEVGKAEGSAHDSEHKPERNISWSDAFGDESGKVGKVESENVKMDASFDWNNEFGTSKPEGDLKQDKEDVCQETTNPQQDEPQKSGPEVSFSWDAFGASESKDDAKSEDENRSEPTIVKLQDSETPPAASAFGWDAFGSNEPTEKVNPEAEVKEKAEENSSNDTPSEPKMEFLWSSAFEEDTKEVNSGADMKTTKSNASFDWDDAFGNDTKEEDGKDEEEGAESKAQFAWGSPFGGDDRTKGISGATKNESDEAESASKGFDAFGWDAFGEENGKGTSQESKPSFHNDVFASSAFGDTVEAKESEASKSEVDSKKSEKVSVDTRTADNANKSEESEEMTSGDPFVDFAVDFSVLKPVAQQKTEHESAPDSQESQGDSNEIDTAMKTSEEQPSESLNHANYKDEETKPKEPIYVNREAVSPPSSPPVPETKPRTFQPLPLSPSQPTADRPTSPTAPPPLPPRHVGVPPSLPPRPRSYSSHSKGSSTGTPPPPPRPVSGGSPDLSSVMSPHRAGRKPPPAPPPRVDLETGASIQSTLPPPSLSAPWSTSTAATANSTKPSETSADPFGDDFFKDFSFSSQGASNSISSNGQNNNVLSDPFAPTEGSNDAFGGFESDPFAGFGSNDKGQDSGFVAFSSGDPFSDSNDPFADKDLPKDPFAISPSKKESKDNALTLSTEDPFDADFSDSFA